MKLIMTPKQAREKVLLYKGIIKNLRDLLDTTNEENVQMGCKLLIAQYEVKLAWAVCDYKLALQKKNATI
jgi:hypothetical protein